jgi:cyclic pyranopterin phosphate synthase
MQASITDRLDRPLSALRISVTDRCNFRCRYCMPREHFGPGFSFLPKAQILSFEEITRVARVLVEQGVRKLRITGGEPLLRAELWKLVRSLRDVGGAELALTTNGALLAAQAAALEHAGLERITVSLDALDDATFTAMNGTDVPVARVLGGIDAAAAAGFDRIKINAVIRRGVNEHSVVELARHFKGSGHVVRFIEYMDVGVTNGWRPEQVVTAREIVERIDREFPLEPVSEPSAGRVARRFRYRDGSGEVGVIASVTEPFCRGCDRARLSADGHFYTCLFAGEGTDLRPLLRGAAGDAELATRFAEIWRARQDRYSELRAGRSLLRKRVEMSYIGG